MLALLLDSGVNRKILHDPRRLLMPGIRTLDRLVALEDQQELRQRLDLWRPAFRSPLGGQRVSAPHDGEQFVQKVCLLLINRQSSWHLKCTLTYLLSILLLF